MKKEEARIIAQTLEKLGKRDGVPSSEVRKSIQLALLVGMFNPDPQVQAYWKTIPHTGDFPTVEEVILSLATRCT